MADAHGSSRPPRPGRGRLHGRRGAVAHELDQGQAGGHGRQGGHRGQRPQGLGAQLSIFKPHGDYAKGLPHVKTNGVPECERCGSLCKFKDDDGKIWTAAKRAAGDPGRGQEAPDLNGRFRWKCPNGCAGLYYTRPFDDPRLYTYYHRAGTHRRAIERLVYSWRHNAIESINSSLKRLNLGDTGVDRQEWGGDVAVAWTFALGLYGLTARRLADEVGHYDAAMAEACELGLFDKPSVTNPNPGPDAFTLARVLAEREAQLGPPRAPRSWPDDEDVIGVAA